MTWVSFWQRQLKSKLNYNSQQFKDNALMKFENLQNFKIPPSRLLRTPMPRPASRWTNFSNYVGSKICQISKLDNKLSDFVENISKFPHMATLNLFFIFLLHLQNSGQRLPIYHTDQNETMSQKRPKMIQFCIECHPIMYFIFQATHMPASAGVAQECLSQ